MLHRTQIYIEEGVFSRLKVEASREHVPVSELIRRSIGGFLNAKEKNISWDKDPLTKAVGKIKLDVSDASIRHDEYLYGQDSH